MTGLSLTRSDPKGAARKAIRSDRKWFARHQARSYRVRPSVPAEISPQRPAPIEHMWWTLVHQITEGIRARGFVCLPVFAAPADNDHSLAKIFESCAHGGGHRVWTPIKHLRPHKLNGLRFHPAFWSDATVGGVQ